MMNRTPLRTNSQLPDVVTPRVMNISPIDKNRRALLLLLENLELIVIPSPKLISDIGD